MVVDVWPDHDIKTEWEHQLSTLLISLPPTLVPSLSGQLLGDRVLLTLGEVMSRFPCSPTLQISVISALAVGLGCCPESRLRLLSQHGTLLDLVLAAMETFSDSDQLQAYGCSFLALLMVEGK